MPISSTRHVSFCRTVRDSDGLSAATKTFDGVSETLRHVTCILTWIDLNARPPVRRLSQPTLTRLHVLCFRLWQLHEPRMSVRIMVVRHGRVGLRFVSKQRHLQPLMHFLHRCTGSQWQKQATPEAVKRPRPPWSTPAEPPRFVKRARSCPSLPAAAPRFDAHTTSQ